MSSGASGGKTSTERYLTCIMASMKECGPEYRDTVYKRLLGSKESAQELVKDLLDGNLCMPLCLKMNLCVASRLIHRTTKVEREVMNWLGAGARRVDRKLAKKKIKSLEKHQTFNRASELMQYTNKSCTCRALYKMYKRTERWEQGATYGVHCMYMKSDSEGNCCDGDKGAECKMEIEKMIMNMEDLSTKEDNKMVEMFLMKLKSLRGIGDTAGDPDVWKRLEKQAKGEFDMHFLSGVRK